MIDPKVIMINASSVRVDDTWHHVLGYDVTDDVLCLENYTGQDITVVNASTVIDREDVLVEINLQEALDFLLPMS